MLPPKDSIITAKFGSDNGDLLIASGRALLIQTTLAMRLGRRAIKKRNTRLKLSFMIHHKEYVPNSEYHGSGMHLANDIFLPNILLRLVLMQSESTGAENGFLAPAMQQSKRWSTRRR